MRFRVSTTGLRPFALALIALALTVRALIPTGWMPVVGEKGFAITICAGGEMQTMWMDGQGKLHKADPSKKKDGGTSGQDCPYASLTAAAIPALSGYAAIVPVPAESERAGLPGEVAIGHGLAAPPPPATGPPLTA